MIIDAHHHLWEYNPTDYNWIDDSMAVLKQDYLPGQLAAEMRRSGVTATVVVEARPTEEETRWLLDCANRFPFIAGVVGWADLRSDDLEGKLEDLCSNPKMVGVRHVLQDEPDPDFMLQPRFLRGIGCLAGFDLTYDLLIFPQHLENTIRLVERFPDQRFVLDHLGKPFIREGKLSPWDRLMKRLADHGNVWCKISGMVTEASLDSWTYDDLVPYMETVLEAFGTGRIMVGSDWPVCRLAGEYDQVLQVPLKFFGNQSPEVKERILYRNAMECYRMNI
jgi:L-fuconolactonase